MTLSIDITSCPLMLHLALGCGTAMKGTVMLISCPAMMVMSLRLRSLVILGGHRAGTHWMGSEGGTRSGH